MKKWVEISTKSDQTHLEALSEFLSSQGIANEVEFIETDEAAFESVFEDAKGRFDQIRIGGPLRDLVPRSAPRLPSLLLSLKSADALVCDLGAWWPRNFLYGAVLRLIANDSRDLDLTGAVFVLGATPDARAVVAALARVGFKRFNLSDPDEKRARAMLAEFEKAFFNSTFEFTHSHMVTQLPGVHSVAVNTLAAREHPDLVAELSYFNFLKTGGIWMDLNLDPVRSPLSAEAETIGAQVESGPDIATCVDHDWVESCFGTRIDARAYKTFLLERLETAQSAD